MLCNAINMQYAICNSVYSSHNNAMINVMQCNQCATCNSVYSSPPCGINKAKKCDFIQNTTYN